MTRKHIFTAVLLLAIAAICVLSFRSKTPSPTGPVQKKPGHTSTVPSSSVVNDPSTNSGKEVPIPDFIARKLSADDLANVRTILKVFGAPIAFYGKVVDQDGNSIAGAKVQYGAIDKYFKDGTNYEGISDEKGLFSITGIKGAAILVSVWKEGYYPIDKHSAGGFSPVVVTPEKRADMLKPPYKDGYDTPYPTKENPALFELRKMGETEMLVHIEKYVKIPRDGTAVGISLETGGKVALGQDDFRVEVWTQDQDKDAKGHYDWKCRITVPNGGLSERKGDFSFEAPAEGYRPSEEIEIHKGAERWVPQASREYFVRLGGNRYARVHFEMIAGGDHFFAITSFLNPSGSRNLEYNPAKRINK